MDRSVKLQLFVDTMERHWVDVLRNERNPNLRKAWSQKCETLNEALRQGARWAKDGEPSKWVVVTMETGTGKTEGLIVYCSLLSPEVGVLVVAELIDEANRIARAINEMTGEDRAVALHSKSKLSQEVVVRHPVLVVTHSAFLQSMAAFNLSCDLTDRRIADRQLRQWSRRWHTQQKWEGGSRSLTIIDESPQLIEPVSLTLQGLREATAIIPAAVWREFPEAKHAVDLLARFIGRVEESAVAANDAGEKFHNRVTWTMDEFRAWFPRDGSEADRLCSAASAFFEATDFTAFLATLKEHHVRSELQRRRDPDRPTETQGALAEVMREIGWLLQRFIHVHTRVSDGQGVRAYSTAKCIIPDSGPPAVILDATGENDPVYPLLSDRVGVAPRAIVCRCYQNVTVHVARLRGLGKRASVKSQTTRIPALFEALRIARGGRTNDRVLCVGHQAIEHSMILHKPEQCETAHWNGFHGVNDYQHFPAVAFFSLLYPDDTISELEYNAACGPQSEDWFASSEAAFVRRSMRHKKLANSIVQGINRVRCRRPIDNAGNCHPTDVYLPLPPGLQGDEILRLVQEQMPGLRVAAWAVREGARGSKNARPNFRDALRKMLENLEDGERVLFSQILKELQCSKGRLHQLIHEMDDPRTVLGLASESLGVRYVRGAVGRPGFFVRAGSSGRAA
jgi:hypothetical protein